MALKHAILAFLSRQPLSGYEVAKELDEGFGSCFWRASLQQVYVELGKLEQQGNVTYEAIPQPGRLDKKIYSLTPQGHKELTNWLMKPTEPATIREDLGVIGLAGHLIDIEVIVCEIERRRQLHLEKVQQIQKLDEQFSHNLESLALRDVYMHLIIRRAIRYHQDWAAWCDEALQLITALPEYK
ncbi:PadR family transcriptional regulator [Nostoc sp. CHAB 5715]|uniref:PadR family transcriptional regulator n=1 Tax=Nostoc sp. CHAB 5715 TaxID=2780400 RepID=UPI001E5890BC|nr:PadR family transcriptional regulator [Nostoc sp. CHAB 5715]MCC5624990.1 PadR family transcriptional regulator [Nostoc sp. CHAB 5715]